MSRRRGREMTRNEYFVAVPDMQLPKEYDHVPMGQEAAYKKMKDFEEKQKEAEEKKENE